MKRREKIKNDDKKFILPRMLIAVLVIFVVVYFGSVVMGFRPFYNASAEKNAIADIYEDTEKVDALVAQRYKDLYDVKNAMTEDDMASTDKIADFLQEYVGSDLFGDLRFFSQGVVYDVNGEPVEKEVQEVQDFAGLNQKACSGEYLDIGLKKSCIAFYIPIVGSEHIDGLASILEARNFIDVTTVLNERAHAVAIITKSGTNLGQMVREDLGFTIGNDYYKFIDDRAQTKEAGNKVMQLVHQGEGVVHLDVKGTAHTISVKAISSTDSKLYLVSLSLSEDLIMEEMEYLRHTITLFGIAIVSFGVSIAYAFLYHKTAKKQIKRVSFTYPNMDCPNLEQFKLDVINTINPLSANLRKYSVVVFKISGFMSLNKHFGEETTETMLKQAAKIFAGFCEYEETYAYLGNGAFVMYLKYPDEASFARRIGIIKAISGKNQAALDKGVNLRFSVGVCHAFGGTKGAAGDMVENAMTACNIAKDKVSRSYIVYDMKINEKLAKNEKIESMMEDSLKNGDFKLFLQPKYNVKNDRIDSAEALVRWFDHTRADYIFPVDFIGLFETNGFIVKLDHYVYLEVLKYFQKAVERGDKIVPISVNVSRVTASMDDFLDFYIENKKKFNIGDGFLMLEFTESFAVDDNDNILRIVETLHKNGIRCSLDDFGAGFSSFNVLKNIPFDELKLDKCFIDAGYNAEHDEIMLKSVISLAKQLGMHIVQEGVENEAMFNRVKSYGCDVIQGFYYAKAIPVEEYRIFTETNTSIVYKSKVK